MGARAVAGAGVVLGLSLWLGACLGDDSGSRADGTESAARDRPAVARATAMPGEQPEHSEAPHVERGVASNVSPPVAADGSEGAAPAPLPDGPAELGRPIAASRGATPKREVAAKVAKPPILPKPRPPRPAFDTAPDPGQYDASCATARDCMRVRDATSCEVCACSAVALNAAGASRFAEARRSYLGARCDNRPRVRCPSCPSDTVACDAGKCVLAGGLEVVVFLERLQDENLVALYKGMRSALSRTRDCYLQLPVGKEDFVHRLEARIQVDAGKATLKRVDESGTSGSLFTCVEQRFSVLLPTFPAGLRADLRTILTFARR